MNSKSQRTTDESILDSKEDRYMSCPNCDSFIMYRDVWDKINSCHDCGFTHFVGLQTVREAIEVIDEIESNNG